MTLDKLKVAARQHEQREEWPKAIELYRQAIRAAEGSAEGGDPALHNRVGDLEHKAGNDSAACEAWALAASRYGEQGFFNNAIALCGKILRLDPGRLQTYLDLARFQARKRVLYDVRQNLTIYRDQMAARGQAEEATETLERFGREFSAWRDLQGALAELLGRDSGEAESEAGNAGESSRADGLIFLDTNAGSGPVTIESSEEVDLSTPAGSGGGEEMVIETTAIVELETPAPEIAAPLGGLEPTAVDVPPLTEKPDAVDAVDFERTAEAVGETAPIAGLDATSFEAPPGEVAITLDGLEATSFEPPPADEVPPTAPDLASDVIEVRLPDAAPAGAPDAAPPTDAPAAGSGEIVFLDTEAPVAPEAPAAAAAEAAPEPEAPAASPLPEGVPASTEVSEEDDPLGDRVTAIALLEHGDRAGGIAALERALAGYLELEEFRIAYRVATDLVSAEPQNINRYQARVEVAAKWGDVPMLTEAYHTLGDAFLRAGANDKAVAVFRRILELDEHHAAAREALRRMAPGRDAEPTPEGFVDLGAMVIDDVGPRSTRMRTETTTVSPDEDETFREALAEFKRALDQNLPVEDHQTHYDLGLAFREMGLLDEAIGEFQKALRSPEGRLRTAEALGQTFFEQGKPAVAEAVLRSVEKGTEGDADKIGVLYWLGRALEAQGKRDGARGCYERVLAVDVGFHDTADRLGGLDAGEG